MTEKYTNKDTVTRELIPYITACLRCALKVRDIRIKSYHLSQNLGVSFSKEELETYMVTKLNFNKNKSERWANVYKTLEVLDVLDVEEYKDITYSIEDNFKHFSSTTIYSEEVYDIMRDILGNPYDFCNLSFEEQAKISNKLKNLTVSNKFNPNTLKDFVVTENYLKFEKNLLSSLEGLLFNKKKNSADFPNKLLLAIKHVKQELTNSNIITNKKLSFLNKQKFEDDAIKEVLEFFCVKEVYTLLDKALINSTHPTFNASFDEGVPFRDGVHKKMVLNFTHYFIFYLAEKFYDEDDHLHLREVVDNLFDNLRNDHLDDLIQQLIDLYISCNNIITRNVVYTGVKSKKTAKLFTLPSMGLGLPISDTHLPEIIPISNNPASIGSNTYLMSKKIKNGSSKVDLSKRTSKILNLSQSKKYRINPKAISVFENLDIMPYRNVQHLSMMPFTPLSTLVYLNLSMNADLLTDIQLSDLPSCYDIERSEGKRLTLLNILLVRCVYKGINIHNKYNRFLAKKMKRFIMKKIKFLSQLKNYQPY